MKILSRFQIYVKLCVLVIALCVLVGASSGGDLKVSNSYMNLSLDLTAMAMRVEEDRQNDIYAAKEVYQGDLTGYGADCPLCGGHLACMPSLDVLHGTVIYHDETYGDVRIVASSKNLSCGTIIRFDSPRISSEPVVAIVLDRGVLGTDIDLLAVSNEDARLHVGRSYISYDVLRRGW